MNPPVIPSYILVDFDRTLATYESWEANGTNLGHPIPAMVERVKRWLQAGKDVRLFTARASRYDHKERKALDEWMDVHLGVLLPVQNYKDFACEAIWDDLACAVMPNTGLVLHDAVSDPLIYEEELALVGFSRPVDPPVDGAS